MSNEKLERIITILVEKIEEQECAIFFKDVQIENLEKENKRLEELLTPIKKADEIEKKDGKEDVK